MAQLLGLYTEIAPSRGSASSTDHTIAYAMHRVHEHGEDPEIVVREMLDDAGDPEQVSYIARRLVDVAELRAQVAHRRAEREDIVEREVIEDQQPKEQS